MRFLRIGLVIVALVLAFWGSAVMAQTVTPRPTPLWTPTITWTPTSQPGKPDLIYPPDGAVLTQPITARDLRYMNTGFIAYVHVSGVNFSAQACSANIGECDASDFRNADTPLPDGTYTWWVGVLRLTTSAVSDTWHFRIETEPTHQPSKPTITPTPTSWPGKPDLIYPPNGAVLTQPITIKDLQYLNTGFVAHVSVTGANFSARYCATQLGECYPWDFENEDTPLPDGDYTWQVGVWKPLASNNSDTWHFRVEIDSTHQLPPMLTATPSPTSIPTPSGR